MILRKQLLPQRERIWCSCVRAVVPVQIAVAVDGQRMYAQDYVHTDTGQNKLQINLDVLDYQDFTSLYNK